MKFPALNDLRLRLILLVLIVIIPAFVFRIYSAAEDQKRELGSAQENLQRLANLAASDQSRLIDESKSLLELLANLPQVRNGDPGCSLFMTEMLKKYPFYVNLGLVNPQGSVICSGIPTTATINVADRAYFQNAVATKQFSVGEYQIGLITDLASINTAYPILGEGGKIEAIVFAALGLSRFSELAAGFDLLPGSTLTVIDQGGVILANHPDPEIWVGKAVSEAGIVKAILEKNREGTLEAEGLDGIKRLYAFKPLQYGEELVGAFVSVGSPTDLVYAEVNKILLQNIIFLVAIGALALFIAWALGNSLIVSYIAKDQHLKVLAEERTKDLQREQARLQASINGLKLGFIMTDAEKKIILLNNSARNLFELEMPPVFKSPEEFSIWGDLSQIEEVLAEAINLKDEIGGSISNKQPRHIKNINFRGKVIDIFVSPITLDQSVIGTVILVEDVTEERLLDRSRDEFFSIASHELRTPLTAIRGNVSLIQQYFGDKLKDPELREMLDDIYKSSIRLIGIVNDFLDTSRLEMGKISFKKEAFNLSDLAQAVIAEYQTAGAERKLYLKLDNPTGPKSALADPDRTRQVLVNLLANALKFTEKGGVTLKISDEGKTIKVTITDTGRGMPLESQKLLFRKFQQTESNIYTRDSSQGTGLGLYISRLLVEGMGGKIWLESSEVGKGSTFAFTLPAAEANPPVGPEPVASTPPA